MNTTLKIGINFDRHQKRSFGNRYLCIWSATVGTGESGGRNSNEYKYSKAHRCKKIQEIQIPNAKRTKDEKNKQFYVKYRFKLHNFRPNCELVCPQLSSSATAVFVSQLITIIAILILMICNIITIPLFIIKLIIIVMIIIMIRIGQCACHSWAANTSKTGRSTNKITGGN